jgi:hypothetical protein
MPLKYWRTILIASALGVCGLAVWAADTTPKDKSAPPMPTPAPAPLPGPITEAAKDDIFPKSVAADPSPEKEPGQVLELAGPPSLPVAPPVVPPPIAPAKADFPAPLGLDPAPTPKPMPPVDLVDLPTAPKPAPPAPPLPSDPPPLPKGALDLPTPEPEPPSKLTKYSDVGLRSTPKAPPVTRLPVDPAPIMPIASSPSPSTQPPVAAVTPATYKLHVHMGGNLGPRFEVRDGDSLLLKVYCDHIDMQGTQHGSKTIPGLTATGNVRVSGSGISGTCESLSIVSAKGEVTLKGVVKLTCYRGNASSEITSETMTFVLKGSKEVPVKTAPSTASH